MGSRVGKTIFCYTIFTDECKEEVTKCVSMELTASQVDKANTSIEGKLPVLRINNLDNDTYTLDIEEL